MFQHQNPLRRSHTVEPLSKESGSARILIVEDDRTIRAIFLEALRAEGYVAAAVESAEEALEAIAHETVDLVLTDMNLPGMSGLDLVKRLRASLPDLPSIMITSCAQVELARSALQAGASDFVTKPCNPADLPIIVERNLARQALALKHRQSQRRQLQVSYESVLDALLSALDTRDTETQGHSERVTAYAMLLASHMGVPSGEAYHIERAALLHDIGKIGVPDSILLKAGPLAEAEWVEMKKHPEIGYRMCSRIDFLHDAALIVLHHHERWDGSGYPHGLSGEDIPLGARIFAVVDSYDAMTTERPYRGAMSHEAACSELGKCSGTQFDPAVVKAFLELSESDLASLRAQLGR